MADDRASEIVRAWERMDGDRLVFKTVWQQIANYMLPNRSDYIIEKTPGQKRMQYIYDGTAVWAAEQAAAGLHSRLTSNTLRWFELHAEDERIDQVPAVRAWLEGETNSMYSTFNSPRHNFAAQSHELYLDLKTIGTGIMAVLESPRSGILFSTRHAKECVIAENDEDRVDTLCRKWKYTAKQAVEAWGNAAGESAVKALENAPDRKFEFLHMVRPRRQRNTARGDWKNMEFESVYVALADRTVIREGGFREFPYLVPRYSKVVGETWGRGDGWIALPDVQMLNEMMRTLLKAAQKVVDPPLQVPDDGFLVPIKTVPASLNFYRAGSRDRIEPIETKGQVGLGIEMISALRQIVLRHFGVDMLVMPQDPADADAAGKGVTATYTLRDRDERGQLASPMLARMQGEFLGPLIDRTFAIRWRQSEARRFGPGAWMAPPPPELRGVSLKVEYVSPIAIAQRATQLDGIGRLIQIALSLVQADADAPKVLDAEGILRIAQRDLNTPSGVLKTPEAMAAQRQADAEAQQALNAHASLASLAGAAKDGTAAVGNLAQAHASMMGAQQPEQRAA